MKVVLLAALVAALAVPSALAATPVLKGVVGPGFNISLTLNGKKVAKLKAGTYVFTVADRSNIHDFHLTGPGVNKTTPIPGQGTFTWKLTLKKGTYTYVCDPHKQFMHGSFTVV